MAFLIRQFAENQTLGGKLQALRRSANLTLSELEARTKIQKSYLSALENDQFDALPEPLYARNFLKTYVRTLGGDWSYFLDCYEEEKGSCDYTRAVRLPRARVTRGNLLVFSRFLKLLALGIVLTGLASYLGYQIRMITAPPPLTITAPLDGFITQEAIIEIQGQSAVKARVQINNQPVLLNQDGSFSTKVVLERGLNLITVEAAKPYSRSAQEIRRVILEQQKGPLSPNY